MTEPTEQELVRAASRGDLGAAGTLLKSIEPLMRHVASQYFTSAADVEDVVSDVLVAMMGRWQEGLEIEQNYRAYVLQAVRNRSIDILKSSGRARTFATDFQDPIFESQMIDDGLDPAIAMQGQDAIQIVGQAFGRLSNDQRLVLERIVVEGKPPRELVEEFGRSAGAISQLLLRAKNQLRREVIVELVESDTPCAEFVVALPATSPYFDIHNDETHCPNCESAWSKYRGLIASFGILPLWVLWQCLNSSKPALAAMMSAASSAGITSNGTSISIRKRIGHRSSKQQFGRMIGSRSFIVTCGVALAAGSSMVLVSAQNSASLPSRENSSNSVIVGTDAPASGLGQDSEGAFLVDTTIDEDGKLSMSIRLEMPAASWSFRHFEIDLPVGTDISNFPNGWSCTGTTSITCNVPNDWHAGEILFASPVAGNYTVVTSIDTPDGEFEGKAVGTFATNSGP